MQTLTLLWLITLFSGQENRFKEDQMAFERVHQAYQEKFAGLQDLLNQNQLKTDSLEIFLRIYKSEDLLELWGKEKDEKVFRLLKTYSVCASSGHAGPKRREGDLQVPEGFYYINHFNPVSGFFLSLGINYPNPSDRILGDKTRPGGSIYIHGSCVTIGCVPITDEGIKELYVAAVESKNNRQDRIPVTIFPCRPDSETFGSLISDFAGNMDYINLWTDLKKEYDYFGKYQKQPGIKYLQNGRHQIE